MDKVRLVKICAATGISDQQASPDDSHFGIWCLSVCLGFVGAQCNLNIFCPTWPCRLLRCFACHPNKCWRNRTQASTMHTPRQTHTHTHTTETSAIRTGATQATRIKKHLHSNQEMEHLQLLSKCLQMISQKRQDITVFMDTHAHTRKVHTKTNKHTQTKLTVMSMTC